MGIFNDIINALTGTQKIEQEWKQDVAAAMLKEAKDAADRRDINTCAALVKPGSDPEIPYVNSCAALVKPGSEPEIPEVNACVARLNPRDDARIPEVNACVARVNPRAAQTLADAMSLGTSNGNALTGGSHGSSLLASATIPDRLATNIPANPTQLLALTGQEAVSSEHGLVVNNGSSRSGAKSI